MKKSKTHYQAKAKREATASNLAAEILEVNGFLQAPVDPLALAALEAPRLRVRGGNFRNQCEGQLEYHRKQDLFLLFYNNKYDAGLSPGQHHPRTRFSIAHELGHFFIEHHRLALMQGIRPHPSKSEFVSADIIEREADAFAAGLLMPTPLFRPMVNQGELSIERIRKIAKHFNTSWISTAIRSVQNSDFPCEVLGIRDGQVVWRFRPEGGRDPLVEGKCYLLEKGRPKSKNAMRKWNEFTSGQCQEECLAGSPMDWFKLYGPAQNTFTVWEHYLPVPVMDTLVVLLTVSEEELFSASAEE